MKRLWKVCFHSKHVYKSFINPHVESFFQFQDLQHPNEFIRGSTLRFLCKLKESELLEPLMPAIRACLEHRHSYVRRNAVLAIYTIYRYKVLYYFMFSCLSTSTYFLFHLLVNQQLIVFICFRNFEHLIPDAPELIHDFLVNEKDASCKRNAFMMLIHADQVCSILSFSYCFHFCVPLNLQHSLKGLTHSHINVLQDRALDYLSTCIDQVHTFGDILQLVIVELIYKVSQGFYLSDLSFMAQQPATKRAALMTELLLFLFSVC